MFPPAGTARLPWGRDYPDVFTGLGSVDPHKGEAAVAEVANIASLGLRVEVPSVPAGILAR